MHLWQVSLAVRFWELIGCMFVTFGEAPNSNVADSLDVAYLGTFKSSVLTILYQKLN